MYLWDEADDKLTAVLKSELESSDLNDRVSVQKAKKFFKTRNARSAVNTVI